MRALVLHGPHSIGVQQVPDPAPASGEVLLRITATGICGSDVHGYTGENGRRHPGQIMGHETVGRIAGGDAGALAARGLAVGDPVTVNPVIGCKRCGACSIGEEQSCPERRLIGVDPEISSAFADLMVAPAANVTRLPDRMPEDQGALIEPLTVGYHAARRGRCSAEDRVVVLGAGPIGQACVLAALRLGVGHVLVSEPNPNRATLIRQLGSAQITAVDPVRQRLADIAPDVLRGRPTLVLDAVGSAATLRDALDVADRLARVVLVGMNEPIVQLSAYGISTAERELIGAFCYNREDFTTTTAWAASMPDQLGLLIDRRVGWSGAASAFEELASGTSGASKILVTPDSWDGGR